MPSQIELSQLQSIREKTIEDIAELQSLEQDYFLKLQTGINNHTLTSAEKTAIIDKINEISQIRENLYKSLGQNYKLYQTNISSTGDTMREQSVAIDIVEEELNYAKKKFESMQDERYFKLRQIEINKYYSERYEDHTGLMKSILYIFVVILILTILRNKGFISVNIFNLLFTIIIVVGVIYLGYKIKYSISRDNMSYDEFDWYFDKNKAPVIDINGTAVNPWGTSIGLTCFGQECCDTGYTYDSTPSVNKCVPTPTASS